MVPPRACEVHVCLGSAVSRRASLRGACASVRVLTKDKSSLDINIDVDSEHMCMHIHIYLSIPHLAYEYPASSQHDQKIEMVEASQEGPPRAPRGDALGLHVQIQSEAVPRRYRGGNTGLKRKAKAIPRRYPGGTVNIQ